MLKHPRPEQDVRLAVDGVIADRAPRMLIRDGETVAVILSPEDFEELSRGPAPDVFAGYDAERAREAMRAGAGALRGADREALLRDIYNARGQDSSGRPA